MNKLRNDKSSSENGRRSLYNAYDIQAEKSMDGTRVEDRQSLEVVIRGKNLRMRSDGHDQ